MADNLKILAYEDTPLGVLCLRQRLTLSQPHCWVTEVTLNHEFLMSSLHTDSERALATLALDRVEGDRIRVLVGGLGLGYTAAEAARSNRVANVEVIELLPQVIRWMQSGWVPLSEQINDDDRIVIIQGDVYAQLMGDPSSERWDAILIDVDHSPDDQLSTSENLFYSKDGLRRASGHLHCGGVLALWSYEDNHELADAMRSVFDSVEVLPVTYNNQHAGESFTDWLFVGHLK